ncbi:unnamed protein product [Brassica oleracea]
MSVAVEMSYWLGEHGSCAVGEREAPVQISKDKDFDLFTSARKVDKYINVFVTFKEEIDGKIHFLRPMGNLLKSKEVASSNEMQVGSTSADVHTRNEVNDGETDLTEDEIILMGVAEIEAVYASNGFGMREVDGTACEVQNKVETTEDAALEEGEDADDEDYDYNLWHDFVGRNCEWDDDKDENGGVGGGGRTNVTYGGVRGEVVTKTRSGRTNPSSNKGSGSSTNKQRSANPPSTFEDYVDEGRDYIGSSRISMENIEEASNNLGVKSSDQVADTENHSDPNQEEDPNLIRRDQAELNYNYAATVQYPPQPEVEFGFPQTCYCGGRPKLATSRTVNDPGRRYYTCDYVNDGDCHVHKWWDEAVMEEMRARDTHTLQLSEKVDYLTFWNDYDPQLNKFKDLQNETEQKLGKMTVAKYKRFFYSLPIVGERTEQQLILLAKAGLKEEIRDGL